MTLESLEGVPESVARGMLARAALATLPHDVLLEYPEPEPDAATAAVIRDARTFLSIPEEDHTEKSQIRLGELFRSLLARGLFKTDSEENVAARLGQAGVLWPTAYRVSFKEKDFKDVGARDAQVRPVMLAPDAVQHLQPGPMFNADVAISLYVKLIQGKRHAPYFTLVQAWRRGRDMHVDHVWRLFLDDDDMTLLHRPLKPLDVLKKFVERYGLYFQVAGDPELKLFVLFTRVNLKGGKQSLWGVKGTPDRPLHPGTTVVTGFAFRQSTSGWVDVAVGYAINLTAYQADLRRHRII